MGAGTCFNKRFIYTWIPSSVRKFSIFFIGIALWYCNWWTSLDNINFSSCLNVFHGLWFLIISYWTLDAYTLFTAKPICSYILEISNLNLTRFLWGVQITTLTKILLIPNKLNVSFILFFFLWITWLFSSIPQPMFNTVTNLLKNAADTEYPEFS